MLRDLSGCRNCPEHDLATSFGCRLYLPLLPSTQERFVSFEHVIVDPCEQLCETFQEQTEISAVEVVYSKGENCKRSRATIGDKSPLCTVV